MKKIIHHIRKQPEEVKRHILHILTIIIAFFLLVIWVYSLGTNLGSSNTQVKVEKNTKPFSVLKNNAVSLWQENLKN